MIYGDLILLFIFCCTRRLPDQRKFLLADIILRLKLNTMSDSICINPEEYKEALKTIETADCTLKSLVIVTEITKNNSILLKKALKKNTSITSIELQYWQPCICDLSFLKILNKQSRITTLTITTSIWYPDLSSYLKNNRSLKSLSLRFKETLDAKEKDQFSEDLIPIIGSIGTLEKINLEFNKLTRWDMNRFVDLLNGNKNLTDVTITLTNCALANINNACNVLASLPKLSTFGFIANGSNSLDGVPLLEALKGNKNIKSINIHENWLNSKPELVQILAELSSLERLIIQPGDTKFSTDISPLFAPSSPLRYLECNPVNFMNDNLEKTLPKAPLRLVKFHIQWDKMDRVPAVTNFCKAALFNYTMDIKQMYNDRCGPDPARIAIIRATMHHEALKTLSKVFYMLQCIMLPADRGLFQNVPAELMVPILDPVTHSAVGSYAVNVSQLKTLLYFAKKRELMQVKNRRSVIKELWLALAVDEQN